MKKLQAPASKPPTANQGGSNANSNSANPSRKTHSKLTMLTKSIPALCSIFAFAASASAQETDQMTLGKTTYMMTCVACHQPNGAGLPMVFPPITKSPYVMGSPERLAAIILKGNAGPFTIDGKPYNNIMVPQEAMLDDVKIAAVMTYVRANFGNTAGPVNAELVAATRKKFLDRKTPWTQAELDAWKDDTLAPPVATK